MQTIDEREEELFKMIDDLSDVAYTASHEINNDVKNTLLSAIDAFINHMRLKIHELAESYRVLVKGYEQIAEELGKIELAEIRESDEEDYRRAKYGR